MTPLLLFAKRGTVSYDVCFSSIQSGVLLCKGGALSRCAVSADRVAQQAQAPCRPICCGLALVLVIRGANWDGQRPGSLADASPWLLCSVCVFVSVEHHGGLLQFLVIIHLRFNECDRELVTYRFPWGSLLCNAPLRNLPSVPGKRLSKGS
jgi:hypothetical protein